MTFTCAFCGKRRPDAEMARVQDTRYPSEWLCKVGRNSCYYKAVANMKDYDNRKGNGGQGGTRFVTPKKRKQVMNSTPEPIDQMTPDHEGEQS